MAAFTVHLVGAACLLLEAPFVGLPVRSAAARLRGAPWWVAIDGLCDVTFLLASLTVTAGYGPAP